MPAKHGEVFLGNDVWDVALLAVVASNEVRIEMLGTGVRELVEPPGAVHEAATYRQRYLQERPEAVVKSWLTSMSSPRKVSC